MIVAGGKKRANYYARARGRATEQLKGRAFTK
jgi:hypothetical protein